MSKKQSKELTPQPCGCQESQGACESGCGSIVSERNRFFTGKLMTARDFQGEQDYFLSRHYLHNRLLHGWGIVCGLEVEYHPDRLAQPSLASSCAKRWVRVRPGLAIDCYGRELILRQDCYYELPLPKASAPDPNTRKEQYILGLHYLEEEIERVPVLYMEEMGNGKREQANRLREATRLEWVRRGDLPPDCWKGDNPELNHLEREILNRLQQVVMPCSLEQLSKYINRNKKDKEKPVSRHEIESALKHLMGQGLVRELEEEHAEERYEAVPQWECLDDCAEGKVSHVGTCLDCGCPCGGNDLLPLALIEFDPAYPEWDPQHPERGFTIDTFGRKELPPSPDQLTHILGYNWPHGGKMSLSDLAKPKEEGGMGGRLEVYFDRRLWPTPPAQQAGYEQDAEQVQGPLPFGINSFTFIVEWHPWNAPRREEESWYRVRRLLDRAGTQPHTEETEETEKRAMRCMAVYPIPADLLEGDENIGDSWLHVTLKCDFILDCRGLPVDGEHLRGRALTGDGTPGGTFESWFFVENDLQHRSQKREDRR
jgi:hypothetical protein